MRPLTEDYTAKSLEEKIKLLRNFAENFNQKRAHFKTTTDTRTQKLLRTIGHILASLATVFIYTAARAAHSSYTKGSAKFWKSRDEIFIEKLADIGIPLVRKGSSAA